MSLSIIMITRNCSEVLNETLESIEGLWKELLVSDQNSTDGTRDILEHYKASIIETESDNLGKRKQELVKKAKGDWILVLDSDERVSAELREEIKTKIHGSRLGGRDDKPKAYRIPYQNYVFGRAVYWGGERYSKVRLFRNGYGNVGKIPLHEEITVDGKIGEMKGVIHHHSYRTISQLFRKFTSYALIPARLKKKHVTFAKLFLYGPHMFWARFIEEKGYKDGLHGLVLAIAFGYMETLTYWMLLLY